VLIYCGVQNRAMKLRHYVISARIVFFRVSFIYFCRGFASTVQLLTHETLTKSAPPPKFSISSSISFQCLLHAFVGRRFGDATSNVYLLSCGERGVEEGLSSARWIGNFRVTTRITLIFFNLPLLVPQPRGRLTCVQYRRFAS
jgi:hypothetical protein